MGTDRLSELAEALGRARTAHAKAPDDERRYIAFLEADAAYQRELVRVREGERNGEAAKGGMLRRELTRARESLERTELLLKAVRLQPKRRKARESATSTPMLDLITQAQTAPNTEG